MAEARYDVGSEEELPPGSCKIVEVGGRSIGVFNVKGNLRALLNLCPHGGAPLCRGVVGGMSTAAKPGLDVTWEREGEIFAAPGTVGSTRSDRVRPSPILRIRVKTFAVSDRGSAASGGRSDGHDAARDHRAVMPLPTAEEIREYLHEPWRGKFFPWRRALPVRVAVRRVRAGCTVRRLGPPRFGPGTLRAPAAR